MAPAGGIRAPPALALVKPWKDVYKVRGWRDSFKLATNDYSDEAFLLTSKFLP